MPYPNSPLSQWAYPQHGKHVFKRQSWHPPMPSQEFSSPCHGEAYVVFAHGSPFPREPSFCPLLEQCSLDVCVCVGRMRGLESWYLTGLHFWLFFANASVTN